jgi:polyisoprenyl-phosphate glycosyltransferase
LEFPYSQSRKKPLGKTRIVGVQKAPRMNDSADDRHLISLVIPLFNEGEMVEQLLITLNATISALPQYRWELVLIDDGSTDRTVEQARLHRPKFAASIRLIRFSRNFGHQPALMAGIQNARGDAIVCLDADLQDPPEIISAFLAKFEEGFEIVYAVRQVRVASWGKKLAYKAFYRLFRSVAEVPIPVDAGDFSLISKRAASLMTSMTERDIFLRGLRSWIGFKQIGIPYERPGRSAGETKYSFAKLLNLAGSAFFGFSLLPLRIATSLGLLTVFLSVCYTIFAAGAALLYHNAPRGWASVIGVISFIGGAQLMCIGILGEYIGRIYKQTQGRPLFIVTERCDLDANVSPPDALPGESSSRLG